MDGDRHRLEGVQADGDRPVSVVWADGHRSLFPTVWLYQACDCARCGSSESAVRHLRLTEAPARPRVATARAAADGALEIAWAGEEHVSRYAPLWLRAHCLDDAERARRRFRPTPWGADIAERLPCMDYQRVAADGDAHLVFLETLLATGFVILRGVPTARERTAEVGALVGVLRLTNYGIYEVESKPDPELVADMTMALAPHTDEPYRHDPPAITFFHVLEQSEHGGDSTLVDGYHAAALLRAREPAAFDLLTRTPASFHRTLREGRAFHLARPIIRLDDDTEVCGIRLLDRGMAPPDLPLEQVEPFYDALRSLLALLYAGEGMLTVKLAAGEMLVFNNQRLLHGRTAFDVGRGRRHVRTCHVDLDEFHSKLRVMYRRRGREEAWMRFPGGACG